MQGCIRNCLQGQHIRHSKVLELVHIHRKMFRNHHKMEQEQHNHRKMFRNHHKMEQEQHIRRKLELVRSKELELGCSMAQAEDNRT